MIKPAYYSCFQLVELIDKMKDDIMNSQTSDYTYAMHVLDFWRDIFTNRKYKVANDIVVKDFVNELKDAKLNISDKAISDCIQFEKSEILN